MISMDIADFRNCFETTSMSLAGSGMNFYAIFAGKMKLLIIRRGQPPRYDRFAEKRVGSSGPD